jgi:hypothetical protein
MPSKIRSSLSPPSESVLSFCGYIRKKGTSQKASESNLLTPVSWGFTVTESRDPVFSDKLLMFHTNALNNAGIGFYGQSLAGSPRKDLSAAYTRLMVEVAEYIQDGTQIMIDNGWFEKPPSAPDRKELSKG